MKNRVSSASGMFLIELLLAILIFSIASAICLQVFVTAHQISNESNNINRAVIVAQNGAECFKAAGGDLSETARLLGGNVAGGGSVIELYYDASWKPAEPHDFEYILEIKEITDRGGGLTDSAAVVSDADGNQIFSIPVSVMEVTP